MQPLDEHNRELLANVRPAGWRNPEPASCYNLVVLGAGTAGLVTAAGAAGLGARVALIERGLLGGDCLNTGCVPSKGIIRAGRAVSDARTAAAFGVTGADDISVDFGRAMERMRRLRADLSVHDSVERFSEELGVDVFFGSGRFSGRDSIGVEGRTLRFRKAAVCTGARAAVPPIPGLAEAGYLTSENVFALTELPSRLAVIGGGPIGCELAQTFARLGSRVSVIDSAWQVLNREDRDAAWIVQQALSRDGVVLHLGAGIVNVTRRGADLVLGLEQEGARSELAVDQVLVATGRRPNVEGLGLDIAGIEYDSTRGVLVNDRLQTSNPAVYAAGDVCSPYQFTHAADAMARIVIANALFSGRRKVSKLIIPWCTYTDPEVAHVGMYEQDARDRGLDAVALTVPLAEVDRAVLDGESEGFARVLLRKGSDEILGATIVARHAGEMINEVTLAMTTGAGLSAIGAVIHPYPTQAEAIRKLADRYNRTRLTSLIRRMLKAWFAWRRH